MNTASSSDAYKDPDRLEREIDAQRREINETLRALEEKFSSREIASQFMHYFGGPGREWAETLGSSVKANPIPTLLTGIGLTWLMMSDRNRPYRSSYSSYAARDGMGREDREDMRSAARETAESLRQKAAQFGDKAAHAGEALRDKAMHAGETVRDKVGHAGDTLRSHASSAREGFGHSSVSVRDNFEHMLREQPLALGAVGIALGALIGAALPRTEHENRMLGRASQRVKEQGREMAREGYEKASGKVAEVVEVAGESLQRAAEQNRAQAAGNAQGSTSQPQQTQQPGSGAATESVTVTTAITNTGAGDSTDGSRP
jgi:hypothetical protein